MCVFLSYKDKYLSKYKKLIFWCNMFGCLENLHYICQCKFEKQVCLIK